MCAWADGGLAALYGRRNEEEQRGDLILRLCCCFHLSGTLLLQLLLNLLLMVKINANEAELPNMIHTAQVNTLSCKYTKIAYCLAGCLRPDDPRR
jgi:hypothetical protein